MNYKLIALDLDGTTMNSQNKLSEYNRKTLEEAIERGITVVVATGRTFNSLPKEAFTIKGLRYAITSNGAFITDLYNDEVIHSNYIEPHALHEAIDVAKRENIEIEVFCKGQAYDGVDAHNEILKGNRPFRNIEYIRTTRIPLDDIFSFVDEYDEWVENINFNFPTDERMEEVRPQLESIPNISTTSSLRLNIEVGGVGSTKKDAVQLLTERLGYTRDEVMSFGDAKNDMPMIEFAGLGVAMGNAWDEVKAVADYVAETNDEDGVGKTIRKFAFGE